MLACFCITQKRGFLAEAVTEYLSQLGHTETCTAAKTLEEMGAVFSLDGVGRSAVSVDEEKLMKINKKHFKRRLEEQSSCREMSRELAECVKTTIRYGVTCTCEEEYGKGILC